MPMRRAWEIPQVAVGGVPSKEVLWGTTEEGSMISDDGLPSEGEPLECGSPWTVSGSVMAKSREERGSKKWRMMVATDHQGGKRVPPGGG